MAELLLEKGADVNAVDRGGLIPLHNAASYGHVEIAQVLLSNGSHVNANDRWQFTPLHEAAQKGTITIEPLCRGRPLLMHPDVQLRLHVCPCSRISVVLIFLTEMAFKSAHENLQNCNYPSSL